MSAEYPITTADLGYLSTLMETIHGKTEWISVISVICVEVF
jgi:hypothetical protein